MVYLLVYSNAFGERQEVKDFFSSSPFVNSWRYDLPNSIYLASEAPASTLGDHIREKFPNARFLVIEKGGYLKTLGHLFMIMLRGYIPADIRWLIMLVSLISREAFLASVCFE